jgi:S-adenosyl methyltransferase
MTCPDASPKSTPSKIAGMPHFIEDHEDPQAIVNCYKDLMAPGSYLVISHVTADHLSADAARQARAAYDGASAPGVARNCEQIAGFFAGLDMVAPGLPVSGSGMTSRVTVAFPSAACSGRTAAAAPCCRAGAPWRPS